MKLGNIKMSHAAGGGLVLSMVGLLGVGAVMHHNSTHEFFRLPEQQMVFQTAKHGATGCIDMDDSLTLKRLELQHDVSALREVLYPLIDMGVCGGFDSGEKIIVERKANYPDPEQNHIMHGLICVRAYGRPRCYWVAASDVFPELWSATTD